MRAPLLLCAVCVWQVGVFMSFLYIMRLKGTVSKLTKSNGDLTNQRAAMMKKQMASGGFNTFELKSGLLAPGVLDDSFSPRGAPPAAARDEGRLYA